MSVCEHHQEEISKFLKFFRARLKNHLENVEADFDDTRSDRLSSDDVYSQKDVKDVIDSLCHAVKANIRSELQDTINMMALLLRQIFTEAETKKLMLELDIGHVEDRDLLDRVERLGVAEWVELDRPVGASIGALKPSKKSPTKDAAQLRAEQQQHDEEIRAAMVTQQREKDEEHAKEMRRLQRKLDAANDTIQEMERNLKDAQLHISQTKQFLSMKKLVAQKNDQLRYLRERLQRHEPDFDGETKMDDDDDD
ncbi:TPA: hypothetical protein N0F65_007624 [Lagenidium giganteum]|uniref:Leucine zipper transcription factor-like protein 1 n=1 Tax=Lagenidium giganteum TaxID=4803 RepID=A0AAV2Z872_9STRA|nr:TPA: hypothetical protein N0F65_007624 [Lagenidium giganteum]